MVNTPINPNRYIYTYLNFSIAPAQYHFPEYPPPLNSPSIASIPDAEAHA